MTERLVDRLRDGEWWQTVVRGPNPTGFSTDQTPTIHEAADLIETLGDALRSARVIVVEDANACRAFRDESEGPSGPENVLVKIDAALRAVASQ